MRDPAKNTTEFWEVIRQGLADARLSTEALNCDDELWRKAEDVVKSNADWDGQSGADLSQGASSSENHSGAQMFKFCLPY